ncbi:SDR family NAD(P)-dependent oxidoreductase [Mucilaginibacter ginsenosidivorax]|uniref:SDR family oxidoreductase n=1 Tax=Mucilaginibacter ginsenosidivorax TaxID=862126 RepID=A0A5B8W8R6_9SPHI|nr:SDR family oxidoreductase [Mucilaginibacter ginsenosidivorax]QEC79949.1 SDR family oxidoreductase [Mucilaginibacter ginsenosidivorax]
MKNQDLNGKLALVIGGTSGMGKATASLLAESGASVIVASKTKDSVIATVNDLSNNNPEITVTGKVVDITNIESVTAFIAEIEKESKIDYLVNASGIFRPKPFLETTPDEYAALLDINTGFYFISQAVAKKMKENGGGAIVNIGSYWSENVVKGMPTSAYSIAKAGLHALTKHLAVELAPENIRVNAIAPGLFVTNVLNDVVGVEKVEETYNSLLGLNPLGKNGKPEQAASAIVFLLSDESAFTTGAILAVDGGMSTGRG